MQNNCVMDVSHNNGTVNFTEAWGAGIRAVIIKATEDTTWTDPLFKSNVQRAQAAGLLLGAYHFATGADPEAQAQHFLNTIRPLCPLVPVLDFEQNPTKSSTTMGTTMTLDEAVDFVMAVEAVTGRLPVLYGGSFLKEQLDGKSNSVLSACPLWLASYTIQVHLPPGWSEWKLWQYTDGRNGNTPHEIPGVGALDRSIFAGPDPDDPTVTPDMQVAAWFTENAWTPTGT